MDRQILNHWTSREVQCSAFYSAPRLEVHLQPRPCGPFIHTADPVADGSMLSVHASDRLMEAWEPSLVLLSVFASHSQQGWVVALW